MKIYGNVQRDETLMGSLKVRRTELQYAQDWMKNTLTGRHSSISLPENLRSGRKSALEIPQSPMNRRRSSIMSGGLGELIMKENKRMRHMLARRNNSVVSAYNQTSYLVVVFSLIIVIVFFHKTHFTAEVAQYFSDLINNSMLSVYLLRETRDLQKYAGTGDLSKLEALKRTLKDRMLLLSQYSLSLFINRNSAGAALLSFYGRIDISKYVTILPEVPARVFVQNDSFVDIGLQLCDSAKALSLYNITQLQDISQNNEFRYILSNFNFMESFNGSKCLI